MAKERRRRAYLPAGIVILAVLGGGQYYLSNIFAPADTGTGGSNGSGSGADIPLQGEPSAEKAVLEVYKGVADGTPDRPCNYSLKGSGGAAFARDLGAPNCEQAITQESAKVTDKNTYKQQTIPAAAVHPQFPTKTATIYSCAMGVEGGPSLGTFLLKNDGNGWYISGHQPDPATCPPAESN